MSVPISHLLGFDSPYVLARTGTWSDHGQDANPVVLCRFNPCGDATSSRNPVVKQIPLGHLVDLRPGDVIDPDGQISAYPGVNTYTSTIRVGEGLSYSAERASLVAAGILPFDQFGGGEDVAETGRAFWHVAPSLDPSFQRIAIPCTELFFDYFAPNSSLGFKYFSGEILDALAAMRSDKKNILRDDGTAHLHLGRGHFVSDAVPLARILFDSSGRTEEAVKRIANAIMNARRRREAFTFDCGFPFHGETTLTYNGRDYFNPLTNETTRFVLSIIRCTHPLPWAQLKVEIDQPTANAKHDNGGSGSGGGSRFKDFDNEFVPLDPHAPRPQGSDIIVAHTQRSIDFSVPGRGAMDIRRREVERGTANGNGPRTRKPRKMSAQKGGSTGDSSSQETRVAPSTDGVAEKKDHPDDCAHLSPVDAFESVTQAIRQLRDHDEVRYENLALAPTLVTYGDWVLNELPDRPRSSCRSWLNINRGTQRRCFLIGSLALDGRWIYMFEILRNPSESFSTLLVYRPLGEEISNDDMDLVFKKLLAKEGLPDDTVLRAVANAQVRRVRHPCPRKTQSQGHPLRRAVIETFDVLAKAATERQT
jgi:hypothetical protein